MEGFSPPIFKGISLLWLEDQPQTKDCDLCQFAREHPCPRPDDIDAATDEKWGVFHDLTQELNLCGEELVRSSICMIRNYPSQEENWHAYHLKCARAFVMAYKAHYRVDPACPICDDLLDSPPGSQPVEEPAAKQAAASGDDGEDELFATEESGVLFGKKRKRDKQMYSCYVHIIQATGLQKQKSDKHINPVAVISCFGETLKSKVGDGGKTYSCVWDQTFSFQKRMDIDEFSKETIQIRVDDERTFRNQVVGFFRMQAQQVNDSPDHEFYRTWTNLLSLSKDKAVGGKSVGLQGKIQISVCVLSEDDIKNNPKLPIHQYDLETQMWEDMEHKQEVVDFDYSSKKFLQSATDEKRNTDAALTSEFWDLLHIKCFRAEDLPKVDSGRNWCDGYVELSYKGLIDKSKGMRSPVINNSNVANWDHEFTVPIAAGVPVFYNRMELIVKDKNLLGSDTEIGRCLLYVTDALEAAQQNTVIWKNLYLDLDGEAPLYRGRILLQFTVEKEQTNPAIASKPCTPLDPALLPLARSYKLDLEVYEGFHLEGDYSEYQVDVAWAHSMTGGDKESKRERAGRVWETFESKPKTKATPPHTVSFLSKKSLVVHNMPAPGRGELDFEALTAGNSRADQLAALTTDQTKPETTPSVSDDPKSSSWWGSTKPEAKQQTVGAILPQTKAKRDHYNPVAGSSIATSATVEFSANTVRSDWMSMMPDILIYVHKKGDRGKCVGYLRIPVNSFKRPTENWEHGEDLTPFPDMWSAEKGSARCLALKPLKELYEALSGFLTFRLTLRPLNKGEEVDSTLVSLPPIVRQKYKLIANVYQAKELASVDASGLSSPLVTVQLLDVQLKSKHVDRSCYPLWFERLESMVTLPENLNYAPDLSLTVYHHKIGFFRWNDPSIFMGKAEIPAYVGHRGCSLAAQPVWYPLAFEEHSYGQILFSFELVPERELSIASAQRTDLRELVSSWETYQIEVNALALRGSLASQLNKKKVDAEYEIECWGDVKSYKMSEAAKDKVVVTIRKPSNPIFFSSMNVRIWEDKNLLAVTSIPVDDILKTCMSWYKIIDILMRDPERMTRRIINRWRRYAEKMKLKKFGKSVPSRTTSSNTPASPVSNGGKRPGNRFGYLEGDTSPASDAGAGLEAPLLRKLSTTRAPADVVIDMPTDDVNEAAFVPRAVDENGNEIIEEALVRTLQCEAIDEKDPGDPWDRHWKVECEYEALPLTQDPFSEFDLRTGKDECHQTFLEKLFVQSKRNVGKLRGNFMAIRMGAADGREEERRKKAAIFDVEKYQKAEVYIVRVYLLRALQLRSKKGTASACDPFAVLRLNGESFKSDIRDGTINPKWYKSFDFRLTLPDIESNLSIAVYNDNGFMGDDLIGETNISVENRIYSKPWQLSRRPLERRNLYVGKSGRLSQGKVEICVDIIPLKDAGMRPLDYLLTPPTRVPWELRVVLYDTKKVTPKKIYKTGDECCLVDLCSPPNQSDIKLVCGMSGSSEKPSGTDVHLRSVDGEAHFNWRTIHNVELPAPSELCNLKVQIWNINWSPDDCIAEAIIPLWGFFEFARRNYEKDKADERNWVARIPKQWVHLTHPQNSDQGDVLMEIELIPKDIAHKAKYIAAPGEDGRKRELNTSDRVLPEPERMDSFPWYRLDLQIKWRVRYCWRKLRWYVLGLAVLAIALVIAYIYLRNHL